MSSTNKLQKSLVRNDKSKMLGIMLTIKSRTDRKTTIPTGIYNKINNNTSTYVLYSINPYLTLYCLISQKYRLIPTVLKV